MINGRDGAIDLMGKWLSKGTLLEYRIDSPSVSTKARGRIKTLSGAEACLESDDGLAAVVFSLSDDIEYTFGDLIDFTMPSIFKKTLLLICRPSDSEAELSDSIVLSVVLE